ncbi:hypothetical protein [Amycolatopsis sp. NPDC054798]
MANTGRGQGRKPGRAEWAALAAAGAAALVLWRLSGDWWPWLLAVGVLAVAAMIGVRRPGALAAGLAAADAWWLSAVPLWGWALAVGGIVLAVGLWWLWTLRAHRSVPTTPAGRLPAPRASQAAVVPPESPAEVTAPIPRVRAARLPVPGLGRPVRGWHAAAALAAGLGLVAAGLVGWRADAAQRAAQQQRDLDAAHDAAYPGILPRSGADLVHALVGAIATVHPERGCFFFAPQAGRDFAASVGADTCEHAIGILSRQVPGGVRGGIAYQNATGAYVLDASATTDIGGGRKVVDACRVNVDPPSAGPSRFGVFTMQQISGQGSQVVAFSKCP